ncbi:HAMP domain-containing histidine kinase [Bacillus cereus]|uniref:histidine kinase n=1 Tax=Bacillus cereus TaxID=1396 RepID=A0AB34D4M9_BACCE|nr:HAMP domain-containing sensor histidine kinase [Bacillus cereus]KAB2494312.1 HAMP domain-containing histidine kinase [Bacillus cereus]
MKRKKGLFSSLVINYLVIITITLISSFSCITYVFVNILNGNGINQEAVRAISAREIVRSDYKNIQAEALLKLGGWVEIVKNEQTVYTIGEKKDALKKYGIDNLVYSIRSPFSTYEIDIAPFIGEDGEKYYCIVKVPLTEFLLTIVPDINYKILNNILLSVLFCFLINGCVIFFFIRKFSKPLKIIRNGIKSMTETQNYAPLTFNSYKEIEEIKYVFNHMVDRLNTNNQERKSSDERKKRMLCDISHDIRTPMTSIIGYSKTLAEQQLTPEKQKLFAGYVYSKSLQLGKLIENLFNFAKLDSPSYKLQLQKEDLIEFIKEIIVSYYGEIEEKEFHLNTFFPKHPVYLNLDSQLMKRAIGNIIVNALKYNPKQTSISISLKDEVESTIIEIADNGIGISPIVIKCIFDEFVRGDTTRSSDGGSGLGLAISKRIIELHQGYIIVDSTLNRGTTFSIVLPKYIVNDNEIS